MAFSSGWMLEFFQQGWQKKVRYFEKHGGFFV